VTRCCPWFKTEGEIGPASEEPRRPDAHGCIMVWMIEDHPPSSYTEYKVVGGDGRHEWQARL
jgi:hypothetical protein